MFAGETKLGLTSVNVGKETQNGKTTNGHVQTKTSFFDRLDTAKKRSFTERIGAQIMIRLKHLLLSWFGLKPLLWYVHGQNTVNSFSKLSMSHSSSISAYPSFLRPKGIPEIDYLTLLGIRILWIFSCIVRQGI